MPTSKRRLTSHAPSLTGCLQLRTDEINGRNDRNTDAGRDQSILYGRGSGFNPTPVVDVVNAQGFGKESEFAG